jgi:hypothetical protein
MCVMKEGVIRYVSYLIGGLNFLALCDLDNTNIKFSSLFYLWYNTKTVAPG